VLPPQSVLKSELERSEEESEMRSLSPGKIPIDVLDRTVLKFTGAPSPLVVTPPRAGLDFAALRTGGKYLIVSTDPITGVEWKIGEYAVKVSANDVATSGNRPQFAESVILLPEGSSAKTVEEVTRQMDAAAKGIGVTILGGHTEITPRLSRPIVVVTTFSVVDDYVSSGDARAGDVLMMTKSAGLEGTAVLSGVKRARIARRFLDRLSIVEEAVAAYRTGFVHAMHDCTEGGVIGAAFEMSLASRVGFSVEEWAIKVAQETLDTCRRFSIDPLKLIGSGALLLSVERGKESDVARALGSVCEATPIGQFTEEGRLLIRRGGKTEAVLEAPEDELWRVLGKAR
jgi:hydrogenase maturation factor